MNPNKAGIVSRNQVNISIGFIADQIRIRIKMMMSTFR